MTTVNCTFKMINEKSNSRKESAVIQSYTYSTVTVMDKDSRLKVAAYIKISYILFYNGEKPDLTDKLSLCKLRYLVFISNVMRKMMMLMFYVKSSSWVFPKNLSDILLTLVSLCIFLFDIQLIGTLVFISKDVAITISNLDSNCGYCKAMGNMMFLYQKSYTESLNFYNSVTNGEQESYIKN